MANGAAQTGHAPASVLSEVGFDSPACVDAAYRPMSRACRHFRYPNSDRARDDHEDVMKTWSTGAAVGYIGAAVFLAVVALVAHTGWDEMAAQALIVRSPQTLTQTLEVVLNARQQKDYYRLFDRGAVDSSLVDARLRASAGVDVRSTRISADSGLVTLAFHRRDRSQAPGLFVRVVMRVASNETKTRGDDTVWLEAPGLHRLADRGDYIPLVASKGTHPMTSEIMAILTHYPSVAMMERARRPWLAVWATAVTLLVALVARAVQKTLRR